jgi:hypothetical protein
MVVSHETLTLSALTVDGSPNMIVPLTKSVVE